MVARMVLPTVGLGFSARGKQKVRLDFTNDLLDVDRLVQHGRRASPSRAHCGHSQEELLSQSQVPYCLLGHHHRPGVHRHPLGG